MIPALAADWIGIFTLQYSVQTVLAHRRNPRPFDKPGTGLAFPRKTRKGLALSRFTGRFRVEVELQSSVSHGHGAKAE